MLKHIKQIKYLLYLQLEHKNKHKMALMTITFSRLTSGTLLSSIRHVLITDLKIIYLVVHYFKNKKIKSINETFNTDLKLNL